MVERERLLVNYFYAPPMGHVIEALRYALGYHRADPGRLVSVVLNAASPTELARLSTFVDDVYPIAFPMGDVGPDERPPVEQLPAAWDWVVDDFRRWDPEHLRAHPGFARYHEACDRHFSATAGRGSVSVPPPSYVPHQQLRLQLPDDARQRAAELVRGSPAFALLPAGGGLAAAYPSARSWSLVVRALLDRWPGATIALIGKLTVDGRSTSSLGRADVDRLLRCSPQVVDCFDLDLTVQLAVTEACDVFVSAHSGFGMAAVAVGTPWLAISGGLWHEYFFNGVPFQSVLPDPDRYRSFTGFDAPPPLHRDKGRAGPRFACMTYDRVRRDVPRIVDAAAALVEGRVDYESALAEHFAGLLRAYGGDRERLYSVDQLHLAYV